MKEQRCELFAYKKIPWGKNPVYVVVSSLTPGVKGVIKENDGIEGVTRRVLHFFRHTL